MPLRMACWPAEKPPSEGRTALGDTGVATQALSFRPSRDQVTALQGQMVTILLASPSCQAPDWRDRGDGGHGDTRTRGRGDAGQDELRVPARCCYVVSAPHKLRSHSRKVSLMRLSAACNRKEPRVPETPRNAPENWTQRTAARPSATASHLLSLVGRGFCTGLSFLEGRLEKTTTERESKVRLEIK